MSFAGVSPGMGPPGNPSVFEHRVGTRSAYCCSRTRLHRPSAVIAPTQPEFSWLFLPHAVTENGVYYGSQPHARNILLSYSLQPGSCPSFDWLRASVPGRSLALLIVAAAIGTAGMDERLISMPSAASHVLGHNCSIVTSMVALDRPLTSDPMGIQAARGLMLAETLGSNSSKGSVVSPWGKINSGGATPVCPTRFLRQRPNCPGPSVAVIIHPLSQPLRDSKAVRGRSGLGQLGLPT